MASPNSVHASIPLHEMHPSAEGQLKRPESFHNAEASGSQSAVQFGRNSGRRSITETSLLNPEAEVKPIKQDVEDPLHDGNPIKLWTSEDPYTYPIPKPESKPESDPWGTCYDLGRKYDKERCDAWRDEVDKLLLFASLFSAAVTAFTVESYKLLQPDPNEATSTLLLLITQQLDNVVRQNTTAPRLIRSPEETFSPSASAVQVNVCWFLSLTLSLTTVLVGILCLQWLREYQRDANLPHQEAISLRQLRFEGLEKWRVPSIMAGLPLLLQAALILFFAGLVILLWTINKTVAAVVTVTVGTTVLFLIATTLIPSIQSMFAKEDLLPNQHLPQCPYKSPQAWAFRPVCIGVGIAFARIRAAIKKYQGNQDGVTIWSTRGKTFRKLLKARDWSENDVLYRHTYRVNTILQPLGSLQDFTTSRGAALGLSWIASTFTQNTKAIYAFLHCIHDLPMHAPAAITKLYQEEMPSEAQMQLSEYYLNHSKCSEALKKDLHIAYSLDYLALKNEQLRRPLLKHRFEVFLRILNEARQYLPMEASTPTLANFSLSEAQILGLQQAYIHGDNANIKEVTIDGRIQFVEAVLSYLNIASVQRIAFFLAPRNFHIQLLTPDPSPGSSMHMTPTVLQHVIGLNRRLELFVNLPSDGPSTATPQERKERLAKCIIYVSRIYSAICSPPHKPTAKLGLGLDWGVLVNASPEYAASFVSLVRTLNVIIARDGLPEDLLQQDDRDQWSTMRAKLVPESLSQTEIAAAEQASEELRQRQELARLDEQLRAMGIPGLELDLFGPAVSGGDLNNV